MRGTLALSLLLVALSGCGKSVVQRETYSNSMLAIESLSLDRNVIFKEIGNVSTTAKVTVQIDALGVKTISGEGFTFQISSKGEITDQSGNVLHVGAMMPMVSAVGAPVGKLFGGFGSGGGSVIKSDRDYAVDIAHYYLIKKARDRGATALMLPTYDWRVVENAEQKSMFFGLMKKVVNQTNDYEVTVSATMVNFIPAPRRVEPKGGGPLAVPAE
ncbi:MAG: hypothetical protein JXX28_19190 [Deltaproteobacteria bacterium]|nr:hypothetical protein [Deltaproteobacteria bacterium]